MALRLTEIIELTAPQYLVISIFSPIASFMILNNRIPDISILPVIISLSMVVLGFNANNMIFDAELDAISKPKRPIPSGRTTKQETWLLSISCYALGIVIAGIISLALCMLIVIFVLVSFTYSAPPLRFRNYWWGSSFAGAILYGATPFLTSGTISNNMFSQPIFLAFFIALSLVISNTKDFEDTAGEKKMHISSLSTIFGEEAGGLLVIYSNFIVLGIMAILSYKNIIPNKYLIATGISLFVLILTSIGFIKDIKEIRARNYIAEKIKETNEFNEILQSDAVTISVIYAILVEIIFGIFAIKGIFS